MSWGKTVLRKELEGKINPEQGKELMGLIEAQMKNVGLSDLSQRLIVLETELKLKKTNNAPV